MVKALHIATGKQGEDLACTYLIKQGYRIIARNWRPSLDNGQKAHALELDIIARLKKQLVFIEVKTRTGVTALTPSAVDNFTFAKKKKLAKAAAYYLGAESTWEIPARFDLVCVDIQSDKTVNITSYENVIELSASYGV